MAKPVIHAAIDDEVAAWIIRREELRQGTRPLSRAAMAELRTFHDIMAAELTRNRWSLDELEIIARATMGTLPGPGALTSVGAMFGAVFDARRLGEVVDDDATTALLDRLGGLSPAADMALAYAVADWRDQGLDHTADGWSKAGVQVR